MKPSVVLGLGLIMITGSGLVNAVVAGGCTPAVDVPSVPPVGVAPICPPTPVTPAPLDDTGAVRTNITSAVPLQVSGNAYLDPVQMRVTDLPAISIADMPSQFITITDQPALDISSLPALNIASMPEQTVRITAMPAQEVVFPTTLNAVLLNGQEPLRIEFVPASPPQPVTVFTAKTFRSYSANSVATFTADEFRAHLGIAIVPSEFDACEVRAITYEHIGGNLAWSRIAWYSSPPYGPVEASRELGSVGGNTGPTVRDLAFAASDFASSPKEAADQVLFRVNHSEGDVTHVEYRVHCTTG